MTSRDQYDRLCRAFEGAVEAGDAEAVSRLFTENALVLNPGQAPVGGRHAIREMYKEFFGGKGAKMLVKAQDFNEGGDIAYGVGTFEAEDGTGNYLEILQRQSDNSFLIHRMCWNTH